MKMEGKGQPAFIQCHVLEGVGDGEKEGVDGVMKRKEGQGQVARMLATRKRCHGCAPLLSQ